MTRRLIPILVACVLYATPSMAALGFVSRAQGGATSSASTIASPATSHTTGNLLVAQFTFTTGTVSFSSMTDTAGNTYTHATAADLASSGNTFRTYYAYNITGNASNVVTVTLSGSTIYRSIVIYEISGAGTSDPLNTGNTGSGVGTSLSTGSLTIVASQEIICAYSIVVGSSVATAGTGYTLTQFAITGDANKYFFDEYHIITASEAATATDDTTGAWAMTAASFKVGAASTAASTLTTMGAGK